MVRKVREAGWWGKGWKLTREMLVGVREKLGEVEG